ncbi:hypothetical protein MUN82_12410 [Hymenobacter aerilatus]|uniref:Uncharacterized protein n=1 Tax=Hymenobacter aerilatus TaxID=2932251 RepID=A0A8T9SVF8_9BACT|nr:hypothetical protein [Hymenobacter aerilatus]UOR03749.1 hypothetical protein MUN82_12410 [Hymenobacter aerilatus]
MFIIDKYQYFFCVAFLLGSATVYGQANTTHYTIEVKANTPARYRIEVTRNKKVVQLRYGRLDSVRLTRMSADPDVKAMQALDAAGKLFTLPEAERDALFQRVLAADERNSVYTWDSLQIASASHRALVQLFDSVSTSSAAQLERKEANRNRIILDGTIFSITVQGKQVTPKKVYAHSPDRTSHPLLSRLIRESLELYRKECPNALLDTRHTGGY